MTRRAIPPYALRAVTRCATISTIARSGRVRSPEDWGHRRLCVHAWTMSRRLIRDTTREVLAILIAGVFAIGVMALMGLMDHHR